MKLVDVSKTPIERFTKGGIVVNGSRIPARRRGLRHRLRRDDRVVRQDHGSPAAAGLTLAEKWRAGPRTYLGLASAGFPNFFTITGPGSPSVLASMIQSIEQHVDWMVDCMAHMRDTGARSIEPTLAAEDAWVEHVNEVAKVSLRSTCSSWYVGANIPGRPRVFMPYIGGFPVYVQKCNEVSERGLRGLRPRRAQREQRRAQGPPHRALARPARHRRDLAGRRCGGKRVPVI